jgi:glutamate transport system substrate-binding protein
MKSRRLGLPVLALALTLALLAAGCGSDDGESTSGSTATSVAAPTFPAGSRMAAIQSKGKLVVGTKFDQPGFGQKNPTTNEVEGFDVDIAKLMAVGIFGGTPESVTPKIEFVEAVSKNREPFLQIPSVDMVVATYTINDARKQVVDFAGPYFVAKQDIMVRTSDNAIKSVQDLNGKKVCTVKGSTSEKNVREKAPQAEVVLFDTYSQCAEALSNGQVDAETTDDSILAGLVQQSNGAFKLVNNPFSEEPYGIGVPKGQEDFRAFLNDEIEKIGANGQWAQAYASTLGKLGLATPAPPAVDRYTATGSPATTTAGSPITTVGPATTTTAAATTSTTTP